jgi:hypothetical protein
MWLMNVKEYLNKVSAPMIVTSTTPNLEEFTVEPCISKQCINNVYHYVFQRSSEDVTRMLDDEITLALKRLEKLNEPNIKIKLEKILLKKIDKYQNYLTQMRRTKHNQIRKRNYNLKYKLNAQIKPRLN